MARVSRPYVSQKKSCHPRVETFTTAQLKHTEDNPKDNRRDQNADTMATFIPRAPNTRKEIMNAPNNIVPTPKRNRGSSQCGSSTASNRSDGPGA